MSEEREMTPLGRLKEVDANNAALGGKGAVNPSDLRLVLAVIEAVRPIAQVYCEEGVCTGRWATLGAAYRALTPETGNE